MVRWRLISHRSKRWPATAADRDLYEHPEWFKPLFAELDRLGAPYVALHAAEHVYDPYATEVPSSLVVNRMSPSA